MHALWKYPMISPLWGNVMGCMGEWLKCLVPRSPKLCLSLGKNFSAAVGWFQDRGLVIAMNMGLIADWLRWGEIMYHLSRQIPPDANDNTNKLTAKMRHQIQPTFVISAQVSLYVENTVILSVF